MLPSEIHVLVYFACTRRWSIELKGKKDNIQYKIYTGICKTMNYSRITNVFFFNYELAKNPVCNQYRTKSHANIYCNVTESRYVYHLPWNVFFMTVLSTMKDYMNYLFINILLLSCVIRRCINDVIMNEVNYSRVLNDDGHYMMNWYHDRHGHDYLKM